MAGGSPYSVPAQPVSRPPTSNNTAIIVVICAVVGMLLLFCAGVFAALMIPAVSAARDAARNVQVMNNMKSVGLAIHNYHDAYKQLPPAFATNSSNTPMRSWRVTMLPFLEEQVRWQQWNQDEPWDSNGNSQLHTPPPGVFVSPFDSEINSPQTHVFAVRHPNGSMSGERAVRFGDIRDGLTNTIVAVYLPNRTVNWTAPEDITLEELQAELANASPQNRVIILFADAAIRGITSPVDPADVDAMVTRSGDEVVDIEHIE